MYQGKFNSNNKGSSNIQELLAQRNANSSRPASLPRQSSRDVSAQRSSAQQRPQQTAGRMPRQAQNAYTAPQEQAQPQRRGPRLGGVIFYTIYFLFIFLFFGATYLGLNWLNGWLVDYEAAQPTTKCQEVFDALFVDPDWAALYDAAGIQDTAYEGRDAFVTYMENKVGDQELTYMSTSAGLSDDKKYVVKLGDEKIGTFTLTGEAETVTDIPNWQLGTVELFYERNESYKIQKMEGHTVYVNGVALSDRHTIQIATTIAEKYLPMGVKGVQTSIQQIDGLMVQPTVTIQDAKGKEMEVTYDPETRTFIEQTEANTIGDAEREVALKANRTYGLYMVEKSSAAEVAKYFDPTTETYTTIVKSEIWWTQDNRGAEFTDETVTGYTRYSEDIFSVRVTANLNITRTDGTIKVFVVDSTLFFRNTGGKWLVYLMTNEDVTQPVGQVRLTFMNGDEELTTGFVYTDATQITTPLVSAPDGKQFAGWATETVDGNGVTTVTIVFPPTETGVIDLPSGSTLEPMVLHAYFEDIDEGGDS